MAIQSSLSRLLFEHFVFSGDNIRAHICCISSNGYSPVGVNAKRSFFIFSKFIFFASVFMTDDSINSHVVLYISIRKDVRKLLLQDAKIFFVAGRFVLEQV